MSQPPCVDFDCPICNPYLFSPSSIFKKKKKSRHRDGGDDGGGDGGVPFLSFSYQTEKNPSLASSSSSCR